METTRDTIKKLMSQHTANGGLICAQSLCGVGAVQNTLSLEDKTGLVEFSISDSSNPAIAVGMALSKPTIYIIRFAGFGWLNYWPIVNYAAKCKEMWGYSCKLFVRCMSTCGQIGPVASNANHSIVAHMPGIRVLSPLTSKEWEYTWKIYQESDIPIFCSEDRKSYDIDYELEDIIKYEMPNITLLGVGAARLECSKAQGVLEQHGFRTNLLNLVSLKPLLISDLQIQTMKKSHYTIVVDGDYQTCGISEHIAYELMSKYRIQIKAIGLEDKTAGFAPHCDNLTPSPERILKLVKTL